MNEGEFKKLFKRKAKQYKTVPAYEVMAVIDEAKKEFPCYPICKYDGEDTTKELGKGYIFPSCEDCYAWKVWFLKWFGDADV